jgi:hypothetical protein
MNHAKLPRDRMELTIGEMLVGEYGYTQPSALFVDADAHLWLHPTADVKREPSNFQVIENFSLPVGRGEQGYVVTLKPGQTVRRGTPRADSIPVAKWLTT